jgi:hypothetical protein
MGSCVQVPFFAVQVVTSQKDMPTADALVMFFDSLGGAIAISIAQNIFVNSLKREAPNHAPGLDPQLVLGACATFVRKVVPKELLGDVLVAYTNAIVSAFILAIASAGLPFLVSLGFEWKSVKDKSLMGGGGA